MTKLGLLAAAVALIALSPLAMAQSSNPTIAHDGSFIVAQAQGESPAQATSPSEEQQASVSEEEDEGTWQERNAQLPKDEE